MNVDALQRHFLVTQLGAVHCAEAAFIQNPPASTLSRDADSLSYFRELSNSASTSWKSARARTDL